MLNPNRKLDRQFSSHPSEFFLYPTFPFSSSFNGGAVPYTPPFSFQGPSPPVNPRAHHYNHQQPPLLPLPIPNPYQNNNRKINNKLTRHASLSVKKSNFSGAGPKREKARPNESPAKVSPESVHVSSGKWLGPEPQEVPRVLFSGKSNIVNKDPKFVDSTVVSPPPSSLPTVVSPPPSSLPLPTFSIRPKLSCNPESDTGATDSLRRMLRLP